MAASGATRRPAPDGVADDPCRNVAVFMVTGWLLASAAFILAAAALLYAARTTRTALAATDEARAHRIARTLADETLARGALAAVRLTPAGTPIVAGPVPASVNDAVAGDGPLAAAVAALAEGTPFRQLLGEDGLAAVGSMDGGAPTIFIEAQNGGGGAGAVPERIASLVASLCHAAWVENEMGERLWVNAAYADAVGARTPDLAAAGAETLLDANAAGKLRAGDGPLAERVSTIVKGERRILDVAAERREGALAALAMDVTEITQSLTAQSRALQSHAATLDRLATAIAIFGPDQRLAFHNAAFETLFALPPAFLEQAPPEERVLDHLRSERRLPETADFKAWKRDQLKGYETRESFERWWHLPDGQTLRVIANPGSDGGVTYIYENVTEQLALERRYNTLSRAQGETIDNLGEGVASFGPDGLLRLANPAFWHLSGASAAEVGDHVRDIAGSAPPEMLAVWETLIGQVTGLTEYRVTEKGRLECADSRVLDYAFNPLPDGSTLATFADVTDTVNVARALLDRNNALEAADKLKNAFIEHVSYELRSPLNTIIGFTQLLNRPETGPLTPRQSEYASYVSTSSEALLVIIDGILDLATIDAGIMELATAPVDVNAALAQVTEGLQDRIAEQSIALEIDIAPDAAEFEGDAQRVRQVLFNLLSNAVAHAPEGSAITVDGRSEGGFVAISVRDRGLGIAKDKAEAVFERFMTSGAQGRRGGVGLGLALVKSFVELHGGTVAVDPVDGPGAAVVVRFPRHQHKATVQDAA
ncbi:ATP-binding protein [Acuticoccus sp. MNP-M23]|uniref:sensor histidine kinase n=1 Tax=Acuticoccus sp. MNP-M23 TaxID=3072793 RepID=UPI002814A56C|nr:ATP-binding protein [Acuticoccus sp. MNP-M23]WMS44210.1 ATP-binding protein [Acuticoccus sp. MNP-M23]